MPAAGRVGDATTHGGTVLGPGEPTVLIGGLPAAVQGGLHACPITGHISPGTFPVGSPTVLIGGKMAVRLADAAVCGASVAAGEPTVLIG